MVHYSFGKKIVFLLSLLIFATVNLYAAVPVHINSGNPAYPFPQFLEYSYGSSHRLGNLGTKNAEGVVHAELEQDIRDAYQIHANEFNYTGEEYAGIKYIETTDPTGGYYGCTESQGYGLLASAYMADQVTFNGYWFWVHDYYRNRSKRYNNGNPIAPDYNYGIFTIGDGEGGDSAADGDVDVALALYVAYKQWGEFMRNEKGDIVKDSEGNPISYKKEMIEVIRGLVTLCARKMKLEGTVKQVQSGVIGLDGYPNGGNTWTELTDWCTTTNPLRTDYDLPLYVLEGTTATSVVLPAGTPISKDVNPGPAKQHIDYFAPAYFKEFWELFEEIGKEENIPQFDIDQFKRGEASSDWLIGDLVSKNSKSLPTAGWVEMKSDGSFAYTNFNQGEDWRCSWRTINNYMWHGNPDYTWNPKTHMVEPGSNTYEYDAAVRMSDFLNNPIGWATGECMTYGDPKIPYSGPSTTEWQYDPMTGESTDPENHFMVINWQNGTGSFSAVSSQDYDLMGSLYRQCAIDWDYGKDPGDEYLTGVPHYMHGWARQLGMMVTSGNYHAPSQMNPTANMKIYRMIEDSVTYCYTGDQIKFILDYRNYGSVDAKDVKIVENVPSDFVFVEASAGGVYDKATHTVTWNIGTVSGFKSDNKSGVDLDFKSGNLAKTVGQVWYTLKASDKASGRYCTTADITCSNGLGWTTNEYPNVKTSTMQRNCVDVVARSLIISKDVDRRKVNDGNMATYTIKFENSSEAGWIDGGRPRVNVSFANGLDGSRLQLMARLWNDAVEPYINYGNYRISYYLYDASTNCYTGEGDCTSGWGLTPEIYEGNKVVGSTEGIVVSHENIVEGSDDEYGKWNQRICIQFAPLLVTTTMHVSRFYAGAGGRIHKGGTSPMRGVWALFPSNYGAVNWDDDWSWSPKYNSEKDGLFYPVTPSWQKLDENGKSIEEPVTKWLTCGCTESNLTVPNVLVEEYDGYVWRRILGNGPMAGRDVDNVEIRDTLPVGLKFNEFVNECPLSEPEFGGKWEVKQTADGRDIIIWSIPKLQVKQKGSIIYTATASFPSGNVCETPDEDILNYAWISGDKNSPISDTAKITVTCSKVPEPIKPTTLTKVADKESYSVGDDIEYTIGYKQTHGAIFEDAGKLSSDWKLSGGATASSGTINIASEQKAQFNRIANNIYVQTQWTVADDHETAIFFRDDIKLVFKNEYSGMSVTCYDGSKKIDSKIIAKAKNSSKLCVNLTDDVIRIWINKDTATSASVSFEGLTKKDGYFGFEGVAWGNFSYSNIHVHTDYAYDLSIIDRIPAEVEFVSAAGDGTSKYYKGADGDSIIWSGIAENPIAFGDSFTVSWKGTVKECSESIVNIAYAKLLGHADNEIMAQAVSGCGEECPLPNVTLMISDDTICAGSGSVTLTAGPAGKYKYQFFEDGKAVTEVTEVNTFEVTPIAAGKKRYSVVVTSGTTQLPCYSPSDTVALVIAKRPAGVNYDLGTICPGNANLADFDKAFEGYEKEGIVATWKDKDGKSVLKPSVNEINEAGTYSYTYLLTSKEGCESKNENTLDFTVKVISGPTGTGQVSYLLSDTAANGLFNKNLVQKDPTVVDIEKNYTYIWYDEDYNVLDGVPTPDVPAAGTTKILTYYVNRTQKGGCVSDTMTVNVIVSGTVVPVPNNVTYCLNETAEPITATLGEMEDSDSEWELVYYDQYGNELDEADRVPNTSKGGEFTYYVSQREVGNPANESAKVPLTVTVVDIPLPNVSMNRTQYCKGEDYEQLLVESTADPKLKGSTFSWSIDGKSVEGVPVAQTQVETITYGVVESYKIDEDHVCQSDTAKLIVKTTFVPKPTGSLTVSYLKEDADANGDFEPLLVKNPMLIAPADKSEYDLVWYDLEMSELDATDQAFGPILHKDAKWKENEDVKYSFYVRQHHLESDCYSDTVRIEVVISDALIPNTYPMNYCHMAKATSLESSASINTNNGQVDDIDYELLWFSPEDNYTNPLPSVPVPSTEEVGETVYKVAQLNVKEGKYGAMAELKVTVFPNPKLDVDKLPQTCGEEILISDYIHLANTVDTSLLNFYYFQDKDCTKPVEDMKFTETGTLYASAFYTIFSEPNIIGVCASDTMEINATIDDLSDLKVESPNSVCPNSDIELSATATSTTTEVLYAWSGDAESDKANFSVKDETGEFGHEYTFNLVASAGACHLDTTVKVKVGQGELTGAMKVNGDETKNFKSCGGEKLTLTTTHEGSDYKWSDLDGNNLGEGKEITVSPEAKKGELKYIVSLVNKCETTDTITVDVYPISVTADFEKLDATICEGGDASASLTINGFDKKMDGSYIKWFKDGEELSLYKDQTSITLINASKEKSGEYSYEVSNGICLAKTDDEKLTATLKVQPYVKFTKPSVVEAPRGDAAELEIKGLEPSDAKVSWTGDDHTGEGNPFEVAAVTKDELFKVTLSADNYCDSETELQLLVDAKVLVSVSADNDLVCVDDKVILTADTTGTGTLLHPTNYKITWYALDENGENERKLSANGLLIADNPAAVSLYRAVVSYGAQNEQSEDVKVAVVSPAKYTKSENVVSCSGESVDIKVDVEEGEETKIKWRDSQTSEFTLAVAPMTTRDYEFEITTKGLCPTKDAIRVDVKEKPAIKMKEEMSVCEDGDVIVSPSITGDDVEMVTWKDPSGGVISEERRLETPAETSGVYTIEVTSSSCGSASASVAVEVIPLPVLSLDSVSISARRVVVENEMGLYEYKLDKNDWQSDNLFEKLTFSVLHTAYAKDEHGCVGMIAFTTEQPPIAIDEYFTPGQGVKETWSVSSIMDSYPNSTVKIYDRTGKVLVELDGENQEWDGTYNGHAMPSTDYWYVLTVPEIRKQFKGHFTLIRGK